MKTAPKTDSLVQSVTHRHRENNHTKSCCPPQRQRISLNLSACLRWKNISFSEPLKTNRHPSVNSVVMRLAVLRIHLQSPCSHGFLLLFDREESGVSQSHKRLFPALSLCHCCPDNTVRTHREHIYAKLHVRDIAGLTLWFARANLDN